MSSAKEGRDGALDQPYDSFVFPSPPVHQEVADSLPTTDSQEMMHMFLKQHLLKKCQR